MERNGVTKVEGGFVVCIKRLNSGSHTKVELTAQSTISLLLTLSSLQNVGHSTIDLGPMSDVATGNPS